MISFLATTKCYHKEMPKALTSQILPRKEVVNQIIGQHTDIATQLMIDNQTRRDGSPVTQTSSGSSPSSSLFGLVRRLSVLLEVHNCGVRVGSFSCDDGLERQEANQRFILF